MRRSSVSALIALALLAASACGSTVQTNRLGETTAGGGGDESSLDGVAASGDNGSATSPEASADGSVIGSGSVGGSTRRANPDRTAGTVSTGRTSTNAATPTRALRVGYVVVDTAGLTAVAPDSEAAKQSSDASAQAARREMDALVRFTNETGGVGGRKVEAIPFRISLADGSSRPAMERHCLDATEDAKVDAMIDHSLFADEEGWACFAKHRTTFVGVVSGTDGPFLQRMKPYVATAWPAADRSTRALVKGLAAVKYFNGAKVGVLVDDSPIGGRVYDQYLLPGLRALGVKVAATARLNPSDQGAAASQAAAAVLRFKNEDITHVINLVSFYGYLAFTNQAQTQGYQPRYAYGDFNGGAAVAAFYGSPTQNRNSVAVSTTEAYVLDPGEDQERSLSSDADREKVSPGVRRCLDLYSKYTGVDYYKGNSGRSLSYLFYCDHYLLWLEAARKVGASITPDNWGRGLAALGPYQSTAVHTASFTEGVYDGANEYRPGIYSTNESCRCYIATGPWQKLD